MNAQVIGEHHLQRPN